MGSSRYTTIREFTTAAGSQLFITGPGRVVTATDTFRTRKTTINGSLSLGSNSYFSAKSLYFNNSAVGQIDGYLQVGGDLQLSSNYRLNATHVNVSNIFSSIPGNIDVGGDIFMKGNGTILNTQTLSIGFRSGINFTTGETSVVNVTNQLALERDAFINMGGGGRLDANSITVENGSLIISTHGFIGGTSSALASVNSLNNATVSGSGSRWLTDFLSVSNNRSLALSDNASVIVADTLNITNNGEVSVLNSPSQTPAGSIIATDINIQSGGMLSSSEGYVGNNAINLKSKASASNSVTINGVGSKWQTDRLTVVDDGQLTASNGGLLDVSGFLTIGSSSLGNTSTGQFNASDILVKTQGQLTSSSGSVGRISTANGSASASNSAKVTGENSAWFAGMLDITNGRTLTVEDRAGVIAQDIDINNGGHLVVDNATVAVGNTVFSLGSGDINISDAASSLDLTNATIDANVNLTGGSLNGTGVINGNVAGIGASIGPGNSPGLLTINGDFSVNSNSELLFELGGLITESQYDIINVTGTADLAGDLVVNLFDLGGGLFNPSEGDFFDILTAETITGSFDILTLTALDPSLKWELSYLIDYQGGATDILRLSVVNAVPVPAAVWLFGSGLLGLIGVARRKTEQA